MEPNLFAGRRVSYHFPLLSEGDLELLHPFSQFILERRTEIVRYWFSQYALRFGDARALSAHGFTRIFEQALAQTHSALIRGDLEQYAHEVTALGVLLAAQHVPMKEVITSVQLLKSIVAGADDLPALAFAAFDRLCQTQITLLASTYFRCDSASAAEKSAALEREALALPLAERANLHGLVGASPAMRELYQRVAAAAETSANMLIVGERGTGKELAARAVHRCGSRSHRPFAVLNCAAVPRELIESELFGYQQSGIDGAAAEYLGLFRVVDGGTLFLSEIAALGTETQLKLFNAIQTAEVQADGQPRAHAVDVRLIASTTRDPRLAAAEGHLLESLYRVLNGATLAVPPLRNRRDDIPLLIDHFITALNQRFGRAVAGIDDRALAVLVEYNWPGNVDELSKAIEAAYVAGSGRLVRIEDLPPAIIAAVEESGEHSRPSVNTEAPQPLGTYAETERALIVRALQDSGGNKVRAAQQLKISRKKLYAKIAKYGLSPA
jgi:two-component system response regulator HydG